MSDHAPIMPMPARDRLHALDAARGFALLLGIVLHATMSFVVGIPAKDVSQSATLGVTFYLIHTFRMTLFFLIAGFFGHLAFHRRGTRAFVKDRVQRIVVPMTVGWIILAPLTIAIVIWGLTRSYPQGASSGADVAAQAPQGFPLTHLWFLYYLCIFYLLALVLRRALIVTVDRAGGIRARIDAIVRAALPTHLVPLALAAPLCAVLYGDPAWQLWFGIPTPDTGLTPKLPALAGFGTAFAMGWVLHRQTTLLDVWRRQWIANLAVALGLSTLCLSLVGMAPTVDGTTIDGPAWHRLAYAASYTASIWYWTFALIGMALRFCAGESAVRRYLADASYWLYLVHVPLVFTLQVLVMDWPLSWAIKFPFIVAVTLVVLLASYHYLVRPTLLGEILMGRRIPRGHPAAAHPDPVPVIRDDGSAPLMPVARLDNATKRYGKTVALNALSLDVRPGELLALLGPNGAGKTTAIGLWLGTIEATGGTVSVMGGSPFDVHSRLGVGVMMQDVTFAPTLTARELITLTGACYRAPLPVDETLALTGTHGLADLRYGKLSAGQKRQVQFAAAVCGRPALLFLDEPTVGLDVQAREAMWRVIHRLRNEGCAIVLTTHYLEEAEALATRVAVLGKGKLIAEGSVDDMRALVTRRHISCASSLDVTTIRQWPGVVDATREAQLVHVTAFDAERVVRRLLAEDDTLSQLDVRQASLAEAFTELTREAA